MSLTNLINQLQNELSILTAKVSQLNTKVSEAVVTDPEPDISILELNLSVRSKNSLYKSGIDTLNELSSISRAQLLGIRGVGRTCASEIENLLAEKYGLTFPVKNEEVDLPFIFNYERHHERRKLTHKDPRYKQTHTVSNFIADMAKWDWNKSQADLAREHGYTRERIRQIRNKLIAAGLLDMKKFQSDRLNQSFKFQ
jgi:hypothetical protein